MMVPRKKKGSALMLALWSVIFLSLLVSNLVYNMQLEARTTSMHRKNFQARYAAMAGMEYAKFMMTKSGSVFEDEDEYGEEFVLKAEQLGRGMPIQFGQVVGKGRYDLQIMPEQGRRNVNRMQPEEWKELFEQTGVDEELWDKLIDCLADWIDENDLHQLNGAEEDDEFYRDKNYKVKNAPVDTIDELLLIKHFTPSIVFGGPAEDPDDPPTTGIARHLTTLGDGKVNVNSASREVLMTLPYIDEFAADEIIRGRLGEDSEDPEDDGFQTLQEVYSVAGLQAAETELNGVLSVDERRYVRIVSIGEVNGGKTGIWGIFLWEGDDIVPVFWREEPLP